MMPKGGHIKTTITIIITSTIIIITIINFFPSTAYINKVVAVTYLNWKPKVFQLSQLLGANLMGLGCSKLG